MFGIDALLGGAQHGIVDVGGQDLHAPGRRNQRLGRGHVKGQRIAQIVVGECVANLHGQSVRLLAGGAAGAPDAQVPVAALLLAVQHLLQHRFLEQVQLRLVAEEAGFVDGEVFEQSGQFGSSFAAGEQTIVAVERIQAAQLSSGAAGGPGENGRAVRRSTCRIPGKPGSAAVSVLAQ